MKRVVLANAYAALDAATGGNPQGASEAFIADYTCFYYEYDANRRVSKRIVFGGSNETNYATTLSTNLRVSNHWDRKTVETRLDGSTSTVYVNFLGEPILTDLYDAASQTHTVSYNRYDADGRLVLTAEPSAFVPQGGQYYSESLPDLVGWAGGDSSYLSNTAGLFQVVTYYAETSSGIDEDTAGGVKGYLHQTALAHGEQSARIGIGQSGGPVLQTAFDYFAREVLNVTIYPVASESVYTNEDGTGTVATAYGYTWYSNSFQVQQQTTTLPAVLTTQNGSGNTTTQKAWFNSHGNLAWAMDERGRVSYFQYDLNTGLLTRTIEDIDDATADSLGLSIPAGWTLPASGADSGGISGLVGHWKLDEQSGTTAADSSGYGNTGTVLGTGQQWVGGHLDGALDFNGTSQVSMANVAVNTTAGAQNTVSFWMNWDGTSGAMPFDFHSPGHDYVLFLYQDQFGFNTGNGDLLGISFPAATWANQWVHVAAVFYNGVPSADTVALYINGQRQQLTQLSSTPIASTATQTPYLSGWPGGSYRIYGAMDDVRIYNRALSSDEVTRLYSTGAANFTTDYQSDALGRPTQVIGPAHTGDISSLVGHWKLDEQSGTSAAESSGYGNTGTIIGTGQEWVNGHVDGALDFNGTSQVSMANVAVNTTAGAQNTVSFWMNWDGTSGAMPFDFHSPGHDYVLFLYQDQFGFNTGNGDLLGISFPAATWANQWVHVAAVFYNGVPSPSTMALYINGQRQQLTQLSSTPITSTATQTPYLSGWPGGSYRIYGAMDDVRIYDRALSDDEVAWVYGLGEIDGAPANVRTATWTVYNDAAHETRSAQGYVVDATGAAVIVGPISIAKTDRDGRIKEEIEATYSGTVAGLASATIAQSTYTAWTTYQYQNTRLVSTRVYDDIPASGEGESGTNYDQTAYGYETFGSGKKGRQNKTVTTDGTITRVVYDVRGNVLETWMGTNDTGATDTNPAGSGSPNNMVKVASGIYDADGNPTESRAYFGSGANDYYATHYQYDWRDRVTDARSPANVVTHYDYNNLDEVLWTKTYASSDFTLAASELRAQSQFLYDNLGQVYESRVYAVDCLNGSVGRYLPSKTWYDEAGNVVKTAAGNGLFRKYSYDGLGRLTASYTSYDTDETAYADADDVAGDTVIEQSRTWYNPAGEPIASATYDRLPNDTTATGELTAANSYATAAVAWYDGLGRLVATADYGREDVNSGQTHYFFDGSTGTLIDTNSNSIPDVAEAAPPAPDSSDNYIVALSQYNAAGLAYRSIDNLGRINETQFDDAGRTVRTIQNYANGTVEETDTDQDATVAYEFDSGGRLVTMTASNAKGSGNGVQQQATKYLYTSPLNASWPTATVYPDSIDVLSQNSTTKVWTITTDNGDHVSTAHDRLGRATGATDQRGVVHAFTFDSAGRPSADTATDLGSTGLVDGSIRRIGTTYDDIGRVQRVTSYSDTAGTTAVNQTKYDYNGWGHVAYEYQEHNGTVDGSTPRVEYDFDDGASGGVARYVRQFATVYPNGRTVQYGYGQTQAIDEIMSRLATIGDGTNTYASYKYLGAGKIVTEDYEDIDVKLDYSANNLAALDRFGRVTDQVWADYGSTPETLDEFTYAYNRAGNRTARSNPLHTAFNETYGYNDLDELTSSSRSDGYDQSWTLDGLGNWSGYNDDGTSQTRTTNGANEITATSGIATPTYDRAGNMTVIPSPTDGNPTRTLGGKYDAWDRLVEVTDGGSSVARFVYDGYGRRIEQLTNFGDGVPQNATHYYLAGGQVIETREGSPTASPESLSPKYQNVWSARYVDAMVLRDTYSGGVLQTDSRLYYLSDANANVTAVVGKVSNVWQVVERYVYSPYGEATIYTPDWSSTRATSLYNNTTLFAGRELDVSTGLYYNRARYYSPSLGTFVGRDPIGYGAGDGNLYTYCEANPLNFTDPSGLEPPPVYGPQPYPAGGPKDERLAPQGMGALGWDPRQGTVRFLPGNTDPDVIRATNPVLHGTYAENPAGKPRAELEPPSPAFALIGAGFIPGVGETMDAYVLVNPESRWWERGLAGTSLAVNYFTAGLAPNFGSWSRFASKFKKFCKGANKTDEIAKAGKAIPDAPGNSVPALRSDQLPAGHYNPNAVESRMSQRRAEIGLNPDLRVTPEMPDLKPGAGGGWGTPATPPAPPRPPKPPKPRHGPGERGDDATPIPPTRR